MIGTTYSVRKTVDKEMTASAMGSGTLEVLATPTLAVLLESAACQLLQQHLSEGETSVGIELNLEHLAPTAVGMQVVAEAVLSEYDGKIAYFLLEAKDERGMISRGTHRRAVVDCTRFMEKAKKQAALP